MGWSYGYVVVAAAFLIQVISFGTSRSIAVYNVEFMRSFDTNNVEMSLIGSINLGIFLGAGPVASALMKYWSHRKVALLGAILSNLGLVCMPFAPNIPYMYIFFGITGLGYALVYIPSHVLSVLYFDQSKSMSTGIAAAGMGLGQVVFPLVINRLIFYYGWRGSFVLVAGINLHLFVCVALLRPVPIHEIAVYNVKDIVIECMEYTNGNDNTISADCVTLALIKKETREPCAIVDSIRNRKKSIDHDAALNGNINEPIGAGARSALLINEHLVNNINKTEETKATKKDFYTSIFEHIRPLLKFDFIIFCINNIFWNAGIVPLVLFIAEYMISIGHNKDEGAIALSLIGLGTFAGSLLGSMLGNMKYINRHVLYIVGNIGVGLVSFFFVLPAFRSTTGQYVIATVCGCLYGNIIGQIVVITNDLLGSASLGDGFGCLLLTNGIGVFLGPPLVGAVMDRLDSLEPGIYISASLLVLGGLIMCIIPVRKYFQRKETRI